MKKIGNILRWFFGAIFILAGIGFAKESFIAMLVWILFGLSLLPLTRKVFNGKKVLSILAPIILFILSVVVTPATEIIEATEAQTEIVTESELITEVETIATESEIITGSESVAIEEITELQTETEVITETELITEITTYDLAMDVIDVGQGLSLLFESNGEYMLYDGGDRDYSSKVVSYLKQKDIQTLDYVIASHYDADHLNGIVGALNVFDVETVIAPDYTTDTRVYESFTEILPEKSIELTYPEVGHTYVLGNSTFTILAPNDTDYADVNDYSVAIRVDCNEKSFIVTGDATTLSESEMLANGQVLDSDVMVIGHHGSDTSTSSEFLEVVSPEIAVISCGEDNQYLHPSQSVMELLQAKSIPVYRTDKQGNFVISSDGVNLEFSVEASNDYSYGVEQLVAEKTMYSTTEINVRSDASTDSEILGGLVAGDKIDVVRIDGDWATVLYNGAVAYVASNYLSDTEPVKETQSSNGSGNGSNFQTYDNEEQQQTSASYVLNTNTGKFHYPSCSSVKQIAPHNYATCLL